MRDILNLIEQASSAKSSYDQTEAQLLEAIIAEGRDNGKVGMFKALAIALGAAAVGAILNDAGILNDVISAVDGGNQSHYDPLSTDYPSTTANPYGSTDFGDPFNQPSSGYGRSS